MIATFGEDYSPYSMEEIMQDSRVMEWELGEDFLGGRLRKRRRRRDD